MDAWRVPEFVPGVGKMSDSPVGESKEADVFMFATVAAEIFTGEVPSCMQVRNRTALEAICRKVPGNAQVRKIIEDCWEQDPEDRPMMENVVKILQGVVEGGSNAYGASETSETTQAGKSVMIKFQEV